MAGRLLTGDMAPHSYLTSTSKCLHVWFFDTTTSTWLDLFSKSQGPHGWSWYPACVGLRLLNKGPQGIFPGVGLLVLGSRTYITLREDYFSS